MTSWLTILPYFTRKELGCHHCALIKLDLVFAAALVSLRSVWRGTLNANSVCRCTKHNKDVGGHPRSFHLMTNPVHDTGGAAAIDIGWQNWATEVKFQFADLAWSMGWSMGFSKNFIHLDARSFLPDSKMRQTVFHYDNWNSPFNDEDIKRV